MQHWRCTYKWIKKRTEKKQINSARVNVRCVSGNASGYITISLFFSFSSFIPIDLCSCAFSVFSSSVARHTISLLLKIISFAGDAMCLFHLMPSAHMFDAFSLHLWCIFFNSGWFDWPMGNENDVKSKIIASEINCVASSHLCVCVRLRRDGIRHLIIGSVTVIRSSCSFRMSGCRLTSPWIHTDAHTAYNFTIMRCQTIDRTIKTIKQKKKSKTTKKKYSRKVVGVFVRVSVSVCLLVCAMGK